MRKFRDRLELDISDAQIDDELPPYHHPADDSDEVEYLRTQRRHLGGDLPARRVLARGVELPPFDVYVELKQDSGNQPVATTMAAVRQLRDLLCHPEVGPQHNDGHSLLLAATNPAVESYDPSFAYEIAVYLEHGLERMLDDGDPADGEDVIYYLTLYNEPVVQPAMPDHVTAEDVRRGIYRFAGPSDGRHAEVRLLASGAAMTMACAAATLLAQEFDVHAEVWSVPGWVALHRDGIATDEHNRLVPDEQPRTPLVTAALGGSDAPVVAVTDFQRAVPQLVDRWVPAPYHTLGTDGFGVAETRFELDAGQVQP